MGGIITWDEEVDIRVEDIVEVGADATIDSQANDVGWRIDNIEDAIDFASVAVDTVDLCMQDVGEDLNAAKDVAKDLGVDTEVDWNVDAHRLQLSLNPKDSP